MGSDRLNDCPAYFELDHAYVQAWINGNHAKVTDLRRAIEEHKASCPICSGPAGLAAGLWPNADVQVGEDEDQSPNVSPPRITKTG
jgi:hypothetical protein